MSFPIKLSVLGCVGLAAQRRGHHRFLPLISKVFYSQEVRSTTELTTNLKREEQKDIPPKGRIRLTDHRVSKLEKHILVWGGKYKSVDEVPDRVSQDAIERARNKARIKINLMMIVATIFGCGIMIYSGKRAHEAGESVTKMNLEYHRKIKEDAEAEKKKLENAKTT